MYERWHRNKWSQSYRGQLNRSTIHILSCKLEGKVFFISNGQQTAVVVTPQDQGRSHVEVTWCTGTRVIFFFCHSTALFLPYVLIKLCKLLKQCTRVHLLVASPLLRIGRNSVAVTRKGSGFEPWHMAITMEMQSLLVYLCLQSSLITSW
jgi:hypothetical protein